MKQWIEKEPLFFLATCSECKRTFSGEDGEIEAQQHSFLLNHHIKGEVRYLVTFNPVTEVKS